MPVTNDSARKVAPASAADDTAGSPLESGDSAPMGALGNLSVSFVHSTLADSFEVPLARRPFRAFVPELATTGSKGRLVAYSSEQCHAKTRVMGDVVSAATDWNSQTRHTARLLQIKEIEARRHDVTALLNDTRLNVKALSYKMSGEPDDEKDKGRGNLPLSTASDHRPHRTVLDSIKDPAVQTKSRADVSFISRQVALERDVQDGSAGDQVPDEETTWQTKGHHANPYADDSEHFMYNRMLSSHGPGSRLPRPRDTIIFASMVEEEEEREEGGDGFEELGKTVKGSGGEEFAGGDTAKESTAGRFSSYLPNSRRVPAEMKDAEQLGDEREMPRTRESQEALVQILGGGWPGGTAQEQDEERLLDDDEMEAAGPGSETDEPAVNGAGEARVVHRSMYGLVNSKQRAYNEKRQAMRSSQQTKPASDGWPVEVSSPASPCVNPVCAPPTLLVLWHLLPDNPHGCPFTMNLFVSSHMDLCLAFGTDDHFW